MKNKKALVFAGVIVLIIGLLISCTSAKDVGTTRVPGQPYDLVILATSDLHGNIIGYSYEDNKESNNNGMARVYTYVQEERKENPNLLLIDGGDTIQGTIMTDDLYNKRPEEKHPVMEAMNYMGYDVMTLGNHEFNWGIQTMKAIMKQAKFPVLAANVKDKKGNYVTGLGHTIIKRDGVKIAIIGVVTPNVPIWDGGKEGIEEHTYEAASVAVAREIDKIGNKADIIVVTAHMGLYAEFDEEGGSDSAQKILDDNPEVDVLQVGHYHVVLNQKQGRTVIGGTRNAGRDVAKFVLTLDDENKILNSTVEVIEMKDVNPDEGLRNLPLIKEAHEKTISYVQGGVDKDGKKGPPLGITTARFQPENEIRGIPEGKLRDTAVMDLINHIQLTNSGADVSAAALFKDTSDLPEGDINYGNIFDIYKFDNTLYRVTITGTELKNYMEWSASCYNQWTEGDINISFDPDYPGYLYDMFAGVEYEIDLSQPKGNRIKNIMFNGEPLRGDQELKLAVNNYRYSSALKSQKLVAASKEWESSNSIRDMIVAYFAENSPATPFVDNNWKIINVDLSEGDPRRAEIIALINEGKLEPPYKKSYNLADYETLVKSAK